MERISVRSSNIAEVGYEDGTLQVKFKNGGVFEYQGVPAKEVANLHAAESMGKFLHSQIKPNYECHKVKEDET
jgi:hypothetical protein